MGTVANPVGRVTKVSRSLCNFVFLPLFLKSPRIFLGLRVCHTQRGARALDTPLPFSLLFADLFALLPPEFDCAWAVLRVSRMFRLIPTVHIAEAFISRIRNTLFRNLGARRVNEAVAKSELQRRLPPLFHFVT